MIKCPVCGEYEFEAHNDFDACDICHWQNDGVQLSDPTYWGGANDLSLNDFKKQWMDAHSLCPHKGQLLLAKEKAVTE